MPFLTRTEFQLFEAICITDHKPLYNLSWDWRINDTSDLSTVVYGTNGRGGFALPRGDVEYGTGTPGWIDFDATISDNIANENNSDNQGIIAGSINGHNQYGIVSNFTKEFNENLTVNVGFDLRTYNGVHWYSIVDKLGLNTYNRDGGASQTYSTLQSGGAADLKPSPVCRF